MFVAVRRAGVMLFATLLLAAPARVASAEKAAPPSGSERVLEVLSGIEATLVESSYSPITRVNPKTGLYQFDCSGMASWVLRRAAPGAWQKVRERSATGRLVARDFFRTIQRVQPDKPTWAWQRVARVADAQPGDVIAWLKPPSWRAQVTGHVGFVIGSPVPSQRVPGAYLVRFADASRYQHQDDTRAESGRDGFGSGTILLIPDPETGAPAAYGWAGDRSAWISETEIVIGRPRR